MKPIRYIVEHTKAGYIVRGTRSRIIVGGPYAEGKAWAVAARLNGYSSIPEFEAALKERGA